MKTIAFALVLVAGCARVPASPPVVPAAMAPQRALAPSGAPAPPTSPDLSYWQNRRDLIRAPPPPPARPLALPSIERWKMASGLDVMVVPRKEPAVVTVAMTVRAGLYDEERRLLGLSTFTAEMLRKGTRRRTADQIAEAIDAAGGSLTTGAGSERSAVECTVLSKDTELCLDLLADVLLEPTFPEQEMGEVRDALVGSIKQRYDDPHQLAEAHFDNLLFGDDHPDGWVPMPDDIERLTRADLLRFWRTYYRPNNSLLVVAGDVDAGGLRRSLDRRLGAWKGAPVPARREPVIPPHQGKRFVLVDKDDLTQSTLLFGHPGIKHGAPDWYAATMVNYVLGGSDFSSRLMVEVRARRGLTYGISSSFGASLYQGAFEVDASTRNETAWAALSASIEQLRQMKAEGPTAEELAKARGFYAGSTPFNLQSVASLADSIAAAELHGLGVSYVRDLAVRLAAVDVPQARAAAAAHLFPDDVIVVIVGKGAAVAPQLEKAGVTFQRVDYRAPISAAGRRAGTPAPTPARPGP